MNNKTIEYKDKTIFAYKLRDGLISVHYTPTACLDLSCTRNTPELIVITNDFDKAIDYYIKKYNL